MNHLVGGGGGRGSSADGGGGGGGHGGGDGDLAELAGEGGGTEAAVRLQADASVLTQQRAEDCRGRQRAAASAALQTLTHFDGQGATAEPVDSWTGYWCTPGFGYDILTGKHKLYTIY